MRDKRYSELVHILGKKIELESSNGVDVIVKQIPDLDEKGVLDPRVKEIITNPKEEMQNKSSGFIYNGIPVGDMRAGMGWDNIDIAPRGISTKYKKIKGKNRMINVRIYTPRDAENKLPCMIFFHGGGFFGGSLDVVENPCKAIANKAKAVVISVDYALAPESKFPKGFEDCFDIVEWAYSNPEEINIDKDKICVSGDSAGGNLSIACSIKDRELKTNMIKYQALLYPVVIFAEEGVEGYKWDINQYEVNKDEHIITACINGLRNTKDILYLYLEEGENLENPYLSPLFLKDFSNLPKTLIVTAEYDFLRIQGEVFGKKLTEAGVDTRIIRYRGMDHAFIDKCGIYPQAEDCFNEIAKDIISL
ncbi:MAG: alpha/beta hydrolase [Bacillota bacterium]|nr:alpha/beta hydrolase [Bacillota bacterium]